MKYKYECIFLDRDGTINFDPGYISSLKDFRFYNYTFKALKLLSSLTEYFIIITNQSGISRGLIKNEDLLEINSFISKQFTKNRLNLLDIYYCIDHPDKPSNRRKPGVGMFLEASSEHNINLSKCIMIGDSSKDIIPASELDMESMFVLSGKGKYDQNQLNENFKPNYIADNLYEGARVLVK